MRGMEKKTMKSEMKWKKVVMAANFKQNEKKLILWINKKKQKNKKENEQTRNGEKNNCDVQ